MKNPSRRLIAHPLYAMIVLSPSKIIIRGSYFSNDFMLRSRCGWDSTFEATSLGFLLDLLILGRIWILRSNLRNDQLQSLPRQELESSRWWGAFSLIFKVKCHYLRRRCWIADHYLTWDYLYDSTLKEHHSKVMYLMLPVGPSSRRHLRQL